MKILGLLMVKDAAERVASTLQNMQHYCDAVYALDDRSTDDTVSVLRSFSIVENIFSASGRLGACHWLFSEGAMLNLLFRMAEFYRPDWILRLDDDESIEQPHRVREILSQVQPGVAAIKMPRRTLWNDATYPQMVPVMGSALKSNHRAFWRYFDGLQAGVQRLHNPAWPTNIEKYGRVESTAELVVSNSGWDTLDSRIERVRIYTALDPNSELNYGVPYDRGLLFGYTIAELPELIAEYRRRMALPEADRALQPPRRWARDRRTWAAKALLRRLRRLLPQRA